MTAQMKYKKKLKKLTKKIDIPYQNYDVVFKSLTHVFGGSVLEVLGVNLASVVRAVPTELQEVKLKNRGMDFVFLLQNDEYLHVEFQTTASEDDLHRFKEYDIALYDKVQAKIHTVVIYGAGITKAPEKLDSGSVKYETTAVYLHDRDGVAIYNDLLDKVARSVQFDEYDQLNLVLLPLMGNIENRSQMAVNALNLASIIEDEKRQRYLIACVIGIADKFLDDAYIEKFMEVINMSRIFQTIINKAREEGATEGKIEGKKEGKKEGKIELSREFIQKLLFRKFGLKSSQLRPQVAKLNDLAVLDYVLEELLAVTTLDEAAAVINDGIISLPNDEEKK